MMKKYMKNSIYILTLIIFLVIGCNCSFNNKIAPTVDNNLPTNDRYSDSDTTKLPLSNEEWKKILPADVYAIAREKGTERAFTGKYYEHKEVGTYYCAACGYALFNSNGKFDSNCGWPSFFEPITKGSILYAPDNSYGMKRTEVMCGRCKSHLGHVFDDGPPPTGLRYCINSVILDFSAAKKAEKNFTK